MTKKWKFLYYQVRDALTQNAFEYTTGKEKKVESPLPGHPSSDLVASVLDKLLENIEIKIKK
ncbi:hypothetical protein DSCO28_44910 [Desulfosarcina ovata subsp. sediminis]|uniref:Uncharacterized protein n=1 Tax=Desulfosarcina ovata subsp. sediminis TaxID=885957 RepID=A0A5K7ZUL5_9BACT|nr:hypothetical protein [Desulfosarcina ovata]BBO83925.1 hypothetical protein DSCO28_44910 [Desulfosarcina ovata subsp. sediminis]